MFENYIKVALRNLIRGKLYSFINITGLAIGISCFMLIFLFIQDELRFDRFHSKADRIYRVVQKLDHTEGQGENSSSNPFPVAQALKTDYPHLIEETVRFFNFQVPSFSLQYGDARFNEKRLFYADSSLWKVFDFPLSVGDPATALAQPNSIVLTQEMAKKYFGDDNPIGKVVRFEGAVDLKVTGVFAALPTQSHIVFDGLISFATVYGQTGPNFGKSWIWNPCWTYALLKEGVDPSELESQFPAFVNKHYPDFIKPQMTHYLQPLIDIHLKSKLDYEIQPNNNESDIYIFAAIGIFILIIACINFMNLATARSAGRAREVGMRKVLGAERNQLIRQFFGESLFMSFIAVLVSMILVALALPVFNNLSQKQLSLDFLANPLIFAVLILVGIIVGFLAGVYPALYLSSFEAISVMKGRIKFSGRSGTLRKGLVTLQFAISLALIIGTMIIYNQLSYLRNVDLGFTKEQVVIVPAKPPIAGRYETLRNEWMQNNSVINVATMNEIVGAHHNTHEYNYEGMEAGKWIYFPSLIVSETFVETFNMQIIAGRNFSKDFPRDDSLAVIINETMVSHLGWESPEKAIGKRMYTPTGDERVIGVVKNFNFVSLHDPIGPFLLDMPLSNQRPFWIKYIAVRIAPKDFRETIAHIENKWNTVVPEYPFEFFFLDEDLNKLYKSQDNLGKLVGYFAALAVIVACLGLFALASFTAEQRTKEIGIRKVLGASVGGIVGLLSKEFLKLVLLSNAIAWPVIYYVMDSWLNGFAYRTSISLMSFVLAALMGLAIAFLTVSFQAIRAAVANPAKSLKYE
ncbi:ABC transporter permease [bacterium]|nr:ABC transporter permease [bacterium]